MDKKIAVSLYKLGNLIYPQARKKFVEDANYWREYRIKNHEKLLEYKRSYDNEQYKKHPQREIDRRLRWATRHPDKKITHLIVRNAVKSGLIIKPNHCEKCKVKKIVAHHPDYSKPLEVMWLCEIHHKEEERRKTTLQL